MTDKAMLDQFSHYWWTFAVRGLLLVVFGVLAMLLPAITLAALILLFGAFALVDGVIALVAGIKSHNRLLLVLSVLAIAAGAVTIVWPGITALALLLIIAAWAIVRGTYEVATAIALRNEIEYEWLLGASGILLVALGILMLFFPVAGLLGIVWLIGLVALASGLLLLIGSFRLRSLPQRLAHAGR